MLAGRADPRVKRRDLSKAFAEAGGGEISIALISIAGIAYGANAREQVEGMAEELERASEVKSADAAHAPTLASLRGQVRLKQGERSVTVTAPDTAPALVDVLWLRDATSGALLGASENRKRVATPELIKILNVGQRVVPLLHCAGEGVVWRGDVFTVS